MSKLQVFKNAELTAQNRESVQGQFGFFGKFGKSISKKTVSKKSVYSQPVSRKPVYSQPVSKKPVYSQPVSRKPVYSQPVIYRQPQPKYRVYSYTVAGHCW